MNYTAKDQKHIIGILGGMGPQATIDLYQKIVNNTPAPIDQDHLHVVINAFPQIPDRTAALISNGPDPLPLMIEGIRQLETANVTVAGIPCNTAHAFIPKLQPHTTIKLINMIEETARQCSNHTPHIQTVGLLATTGTCKLGMYHKALENFGIKTLTPSEETQTSHVMEAIYGKKGVKAGYIDAHNRGLMQEVSKELIEKGARLIIAGCTELPLILQNGDIDVPVVDATEVLAQALIREACAE